MQSQPSLSRTRQALVQLRDELGQLLELFPIPAASFLLARLVARSGAPRTPRAAQMTRGGRRGAGMGDRTGRRGADEGTAGLLG